jgi:hypothetical protein
VDGLKSWKTTITALVGALAMLVSHFGLNLGPDVQAMIVTAVIFVMGLLSKDADKTGTDAQPRE